MARTPSASAHRKVLEAARSLVAERGIDATSMDAIARKSGVSKATIYKHWADKEALMLELLGWVSGLHVRPRFASGDTRADMVDILAYRPPDNAGWRDRLSPHFVAYGAANPSFGLAWRNKVMEPPRRELRELIVRAVARGELSPACQVEPAIAMLFGPILYWHIFHRRAAESGNARPFAETVVDAFWRAFGRDQSEPLPGGRAFRALAAPTTSSRG